MCILASFPSPTCARTVTEREEIARWISATAVLRSPLTNEPMGPDLRPNLTLRSLIQEFCKTNEICI
jgi:hypothetical protein